MQQKKNTTEYPTVANREIKMNKYLKNLSRIEFVVTNACTGKCRHCSQSNHESKEKLDKTLSAEAVRKISEKYSITSVMTFGGEPLLHPEAVFEIHKAAKEMNIPKRQLITNGFFTGDFGKIRSVAEKIVINGVNDILLSVDAFHQETIPLEFVQAFAKAILELKGQIRTHPAWLVSASDNNIYNRKTKEILEIFSNMGIKSNEGNIVFPEGNALKYLGQYFNSAEEVKNPYREDPENIRAICFSANGDILKSNIYKEDIDEILSGYTP